MSKTYTKRFNVAFHYRALQNPVATYADAIVDDGGKVVGFFR